jgi:hypothetical protein
MNPKEFVEALVRVATAKPPTISPSVTPILSTLLLHPFVIFNHRYDFKP